MSNVCTYMCVYTYVFFIHFENSSRDCHKTWWIKVFNVKNKIGLDPDYIATTLPFLKGDSFLLT